MVAFLIYMPLHIFLSQSLSLITGGLEIWKVAKDVLLGVLTLFTICLIWAKQGRAPRWFTALVGITAGYGGLHLLVWLLHPESYAQSALLSATYNVRLFCLAIVGAGATLLTPQMFTFRSIRRLVIGVSSLVALLAVLQYWLPADTLSHLGYSLDRGVRSDFFIDDNPGFPRVMSTLRDPNSLGAYLLVPLALLTGMVARLREIKTTWRRWLAVGILALHLMALYLTFSRSAWVAAFVAVGVTLWWQFSSQFVRILRKWWPVGVAVIVLLVAAGYWQRNNQVIDGILTHSTAAQLGDIDSNEYHWMYVTRGIAGIVDKPLGHGPGTAGLASIQNPHGGLLTENYYVQIGYEIGVMGLMLFIAANVWVYLHIVRRHDQWKAVLLATFWSYVLMNMLLHTWSNEAVAAQWWLLAGIALVPVTVGDARSATKPHADDEA